MHTSFTWRPLLRRTVVGLFLGLVVTTLASCDLSGDDTAGPKAGPLQTINIGRLICGGHLPLAIVEKRFQDQLKSFQLHTIQNHDWNDVIADMESGKLAGTFILSPLAMNLIRKGFPGRIVLMANRNGNGFVLSSKIKSVAALRDTRRIIAVPHIYSQHNVLLHMVLEQHGVPLDNITVLGMPPRDMINSLRNGEIDGFVVGEPEANKSVSMGVGWMATISPQIWKDHMDHVFLAANSFIAEQPENLQALVDQLVRSGEFIENNPHQAAVIGEEYTGSSAAIFEKVLTTPPDWISYTNMVASETDLAEMAKRLVDMNLWPDVPDNLAKDYLDMSFAISAERRMRNQ